MGKWLTLLALLAFTAAPLRADSAPTGPSPFAVCGLGDQFVDLGDLIVNREAQLIKYIGTASSQVAPLEKSQSNWKLLGAGVTALEFSALSWGLNLMLIGKVSISVSSTSGMSAVEAANQQAAFRQAINGLVGTASVAWAAQYHAKTGDISVEEAGQLDAQQGAAEQAVGSGISFGGSRDYAKNYQLAINHVSNVIELYAQEDSETEQRRTRLHELHLEETSPWHVPQTDECTQEQDNPYGNGTSTCSSQAMLRMLKFGLLWGTYPNEKAEGKMIELEAIQDHVKTYMDELQFLNHIYGQMITECEIRNPGFAAAERRVDKRSIWNELVDDAKSDRLPGGQSASGLNPSAPPPSLAGPESGSAPVAK